VISARTRFLVALAAATMCLAVVETQWLRATESLSNNVQDAFVRRHAAGLKADPEIVIVSVDERSITGMVDYAGRWPWPRSVHGELVAGIAAQKPKAIVFDILFGEPDRDRPESDEAFNDAVKPLDNVYFPTARHAAEGDLSGAAIAELAPALGAFRSPGAQPDAHIDVLLPLALAPENWRLGLINFIQDRDGVGRRYSVYSSEYGWRVPRCPPASAPISAGHCPTRPTSSSAGAAADRAPARVLPRSLRGLQPREAPAAAGRVHRQDRRHRRHGHGALRHPGDADQQRALRRRDPRVRDRQPEEPHVAHGRAALDRCAARRGAHGPPAARVPAPRRDARARRGPRSRHGGRVRGNYLVLRAGLAMPVTTPLLFAWLFFVGAALRDVLDERRSREAAVREFSRFVNPHVVQELIAKGGLSRQGESRDVTLLFSDIRGFTTLSENRTPNEIVDLLNRYFSKQVAVIFRHEGTLDKFIGDAIMAVWGAPIDDADHARHAVEAALDMADTLLAFRQELGELGEHFDVGIGIHSGAAVVGLIGSDARREYTAIGDTVNLASRIEGLTKGVARILVSEDTRQRCGDAFEFIDRGAHQVKGRAQEVRLYEPRRKS
jgi:adenylate cyclase